MTEAPPSSAPTDAHSGMTRQQMLAAFLRFVADQIDGGKVGDVELGMLYLRGDAARCIFTYPSMPDEVTTALSEEAHLWMADPERGPGTVADIRHGTLANIAGNREH